MKKITLITDGSCLGNPGPGGWAALMRYGKHEKLLVGRELDTTNNRMELTALVKALKQLKEPCELIVRTDSKYLMDAFDQGWLASWRENGWKTAANKPVKNQDLWEELDELLPKHKYRFEWVKGHSGDPDNELVDEAARRAAEGQTTEI